MSSEQRFWRGQHRNALLLVSASLIAVIAVLDWATRPYLSLGFLYLFPILISAAVLPRWALVLLGIACAQLSAEFSNLPQSFTRMGLETLAFVGCGLFVHELFRNRRLVEANREQLRVLIGTSPAAILTVGATGLVEQANEAAVSLLRPRDGKLIGLPIAAFVPELHYALRLEGGPQFRSALQCGVHRGNSETFPAEIWFSTYLDGENPKLAAILADISEEIAGTDGSADQPRSGIELAPREKEVLSLLLQGLANKEIAERMNVSESTVKNMLQTLFSKTGVRSRSQLVRVALEQFRDEI